MSFVFLIVLLTSLGTWMQEMNSVSAEYVLAGERFTEEELKTIRESGTFSQSIPAKIINRIGRLAKGDLGENIYGEDNRTLILHALKTTVVLAVWSSILSFFYAAIMGGVAEIMPKAAQWLDAWNELMLAFPVFLTGVFLIWLLALWLPLFPAGGSSMSGWVVLPAFALSLKSGSRLYFFIREFLTAELKKMYIKMQRAMGASRFRLVAVHAAKNITLPVVSFWLLDFSSFLAGAAVIETVFALPGTGTLLMRALQTYDGELLISIITVSSVFVFVFSTLQTLLDQHYARFLR